MVIIRNHLTYEEPKKFDYSLLNNEKQLHDVALSKIKDELDLLSGESLVNVDIKSKFPAKIEVSNDCKDLKIAQRINDLVLNAIMYPLG